MREQAGEHHFQFDNTLQCFTDNHEPLAKWEVLAHLQELSALRSEVQRLRIAVDTTLDDLAGPHGLDVPQEYKPIAERIWLRLTDALNPPAQAGQ